MSNPAMSEKKRRLTKEELIEKLKVLESRDPEDAHREADRLLIEYINDEDIEQAFFEVPKWYA